MAERIEMEKGDPIYVMEAHFPQSSDTRLHAKMWDRVEELYCEYITQGSVVMMVDANAHTEPMGTTGRTERERC